MTPNQLLKIYQTLAPHLHPTPILTSSFFNKITGSSLFFKCENFQKTGSFKYRGALYAVIKALQKNPELSEVVTHSSGNFGQALAKAAQTYHIQATVIVPEDAPKAKIEAMKQYGAKIFLCKPGNQNRKETLNKYLEQYPKSYFIHPYNHNDVIAGHTSLVTELLKQDIQPDLIVVPIGGGGLISGISLAARQWFPKALIIGVEPENANDAYLSLLQNKIFSIDKVNTIADGLKASVGELCFNYIKKYVKEILTVSEEQIYSAFTLIPERMKIIAEPSSATTLAAVINHPSLFAKKNVVLILSGGNVDMTRYAQFQH